MMKKTSLYLRLLTVLFIATLLFNSCNKNDLHKKPFEASIKTWYRLSPIKPMTIDVKGTSFIATTYFPGAGTGHATYLNNCVNYFNQLAYSSSAEAPPAGSVAVPIADVPGYPVTGGPLPLIQSGDFTSFALTVSSLHIPAEVNGKIINSVFVNSKGEAIFTSAITGSAATFPISATIIGFKGKALITGGRGIFSHAEGEIDYSGYFNVANANDAELNVKGWIAY